LLLIAYGKDTIIPKFTVVNFKLKKKNETIILSDSTGKIIDQYHLGELQINNSYGRSPDGGSNWCIFIKPSPNGANLKSICYTGYEPDPVFSVDAGFYP